MNMMATNKKLLISKTENFTKTSIDLLKLSMVEKTADVVSSVTSKLVILLIVAMFIFLLNIGLSLWISEILQSPYLGFLIVSGFYLIISVVVYYYRLQWLKNPISDKIVTKLLKDVNLDEELNPEHYE
jgi:hypothetical protein